MKKFLWLLTAMLFTTLGVVSAHGQMAIPSEVSISSDRDDFTALRLRSGALFDYASPYRYAGVAVQDSHYSRAEWHRDGESVLVLWRNQSRETLAGTVAEAGVVRTAGRVRLIGDATWSLRPNKKTGIELLAAADLVETKPALERAIAYTFVGSSVERQLTPRLTAIALAGYQRFTDGNDRWHLRGRLIWMLIPAQGVSVQLRMRQYRSGHSDVEGAYFNPGRYREYQGGLAIRKRYAGWIWSGTVAMGRETVEGSVQHTTGLAEIRTEGTLAKDIHIAIHASYDRSAGFGLGDGYWYRVAGITLIVPF